MGYTWRQKSHFHRTLFERGLYLLQIEGKYYMIAPSGAKHFTFASVYEALALT